MEEQFHMHKSQQHSQLIYQPAAKYAAAVQKQAEPWPMLDRSDSAFGSAPPGFKIPPPLTAAPPAEDEDTPVQSPYYAQTTAFQEDLTRIEDWFTHLPYQDTIYALKKIITALPYALPSSALFSGTPLQPFGIVPSSPSTSSSFFEHAPESRVGIIGQKPQIEEAFGLDVPRSRTNPPLSPNAHQNWSRTSSTASLYATSYFNQQEPYKKNEFVPHDANIRRRVQTLPLIPQKYRQANYDHMYKSHQSQHNFHHQQQQQPIFQHYVKNNDKGKIPEDIDFKLIENVSSWFRSLRLHKYTHCFVPERGNPESSKRLWHWREMVVLTDNQLKQMGVCALGARRKMLRVFEMVREACPGEFPNVPKIDKEDHEEADAFFDVREPQMQLTNTVAELKM